MGRTHPRSVLTPYCDSDATDEIRATGWAREDSDNFIYLLKQLFATHLRKCGLRYSREYRRNYFPRPVEGTVQKVCWFNVRTGRAARPRAVAKYYRYGSDRFWRHQAMSYRFEQIGNLLYLQLQPRYHYTYDGTQPYDSDKVGALTTRIKAVERNTHVLNHVLFWADVLSQQHPSIEVKLFDRAAMVIEKTPASGIANFAIHDDAAVYEEEDVPQLDFGSALLTTTSESSGDDDENAEEDTDDEY